MRWILALLAIALPAIASAIEQDYKENIRPDHPAIQYFLTPGNDPASKLAVRLHSGNLKLEGVEEPLGLLRELLKHLGIEPDSQMLVFSKTSFQAPKISPDNPRARPCHFFLLLWKPSSILEKCDGGR